MTSLVFHIHKSMLKKVASWNLKGANTRERAKVRFVQDKLLTSPQLAINLNATYIRAMLVTADTCHMLMSELKLSA